MKDHQIRIQLGHSTTKQNRHIGHLKPLSSAQLFSHVWLFMTPWTTARHASLSITNSWNLLKLISTESVMPSNHLILCCPLPLPPSIIPSIGVSSNESVLRIWWPKYWSFSFSISPSNEYSGLISFRMDWLDHLAVQGTLKSLLQHHSWKALILRWSAFFIVQLSHPYWKLSKNCIKNNKTTNQILKWRKKYMNRHVSQRYTNSDRYMKSCLTSLTIREMQIKTTMRLSPHTC